MVVSLEKFALSLSSSKLVLGDVLLHALFQPFPAESVRTNEFH